MLFDKDESEILTGEEVVGAWMNGSAVQITFSREALNNLQAVENVFRHNGLEPIALEKPSGADADAVWNNLRRDIKPGQRVVFDGEVWLRLKEGEFGDAIWVCLPQE